MNQAARIARMKSSAVANHGRRLCRVAAGAQSPDKPSASSQGSAANPDQVSRDGLAVVLEVPLSDTAMMLARLGGAAAGSLQEFVTRAICREAEHAGLPALADARETIPGREEPGVHLLPDARLTGCSCGGREEASSPDLARLRRRGESHKLEIAGSSPAPATIFTDEGDLTDVPVFTRIAPNQFASGP